MIKHPDRAIECGDQNAQITLVSNTPGEDILARYRTITPLAALQLQLHNGRPSGVITSFPENVTIEVCGISSFGVGMIEVSWQSERYAVFELDLKARAILEPGAD